MNYTFLTVIFIAGLRLSIFDWKKTVDEYMNYRSTMDRGFDPLNYVGCSCGNCTPEEEEEGKLNQHNSYVNSVARRVSVQLHQSIFHSGITLIVLYLIIQLTLNK